MQRSHVVSSLNSLLHQKLFGGMRSNFLNQQKQKLQKSAEYKIKSDSEKKALMDKSFHNWFNDTSTFFLSYKSLFAVVPLALRELQIREFESEEIVRVKVDYVYKGKLFSAYHPTHFNSQMHREIDDTINYLKDPKYKHVVDTYISNVDTEKSPNPPLTTAQLKYSCFYLFGFSPTYVTSLSEKLFQSGLITNPETNGWGIEDDVVESIITLLNQHYPYQKVNQNKRTFTDLKIDRYQKECIRPITVSSEYFPKSVSTSEEFASIEFSSPLESEDALRMYNFIFYMTLSTQMMNSIYDTSKIEIAVGKVKVSEDANILIPGEENWEALTGPMLKKIASSSSSPPQKSVELPQVPPETILVPNDVYSYSYHSKRPPRYGIGRFLAQILERHGIGKNREHDEIVQELEHSKAVTIVKEMLHPQENIVTLVQWMQDYMPYFIETDNLHELEEKIDAVVANSLPLDALLDEFSTMIDNAFSDGGIVHEDKPPSQAKLSLLESVAKKHHVQPPNDVYNSSIKADMFLAKYPVPEPVKIGRCPCCNSEVYQKEFIDKSSGDVSYYFACEKFNKGCNFSIWDSTIYNFFSNKSHELHTIEERADALKKIMPRKRGYLFTGFISTEGKSYEAKVVLGDYINPKTNKTNWRLSLSFPKKKKGN